MSAIWLWDEIWEVWEWEAEANTEKIHVRIKVFAKIILKVDCFLISYRILYILKSSVLWSNLKSYKSEFFLHQITSRYKTVCDESKSARFRQKNQFIKHEYHWKYEYQNVAACELLMLEMCRYPKQCWFSFEIFLCSTRDILHHLTQKFSLFTSSYLFLALKYFTIPMFLSIYFEEANPECLFKKLWRVRVQSEHTTLHA